MRIPSTIEDLGIPHGLAEDLFMRRVLTERVTSVSDVADALCISHNVAAELAAALREKALLEYLGVDGRDYRIQLTELGFKTTTQRMSTGHHVGAVPVSLPSYQQMVGSQQVDITPNREDIRAAFHDLIVDDELLDQIGPAFISGGAIFLYGPPGTGKTSLAERLNRIQHDPVFIPYYVETDGQIFSVYDPSLHRAFPDQPSDVDRRWVLCERPLIVVGGELDLAMLDLQYDQISGISVAPIQVMANNGILVVDDFGRQAVRPDEILNRWIVPLSRGVDYLKANSGGKFTVPFALKLVVSTNLDPKSLGDDAFLRRLRNKVYVGPVEEEVFGWIVEDAAAATGIGLGPGAIDHLVRVARREIGELRPYLAIDFCQLTAAVSDYEGHARELDEAMIERVAALYFVQSEEADSLSNPEAHLWDQNGPQSSYDHLQPAEGWADYEIGGLAEGDVFSGLEALAATQSIDGVEHGGNVPAALQPTPVDRRAG